MYPLVATPLTRRFIAFALHYYIHCEEHDGHLANKLARPRHPATKLDTEGAFYNNNKYNQNSTGQVRRVRKGLHSAVYSRAFV